MADLKPREGTFHWGSVFLVIERLLAVIDGKRKEFQ
jgi:hypothetical protein